ncbi:hypothetical protein [Streptomyces sp. E-08]|uniref:hypothetical protein n=1 Tax=Streptomyces sp. E-08 TaxID=3404047 RepID=UPI003CF6A687
MAFDTVVTVVTGAPLVRATENGYEAWLKPYSNFTTSVCDALNEKEPAVPNLTVLHFESSASLLNPLSFASASGNCVELTIGGVGRELSKTKRHGVVV